MTERDSGGDPRWDQAFDWVMELDRRPGDPTVAAAFNRWLAADPANPPVYEQVRKVWITAPAIEPAVWRPAVPAAERQAPVRQGVSRRRWLTGAGALAAGAALFVAAGGVTDLRADHVTATGETRQVTLADGSRLVLDTDTAVAVADRAVTLLRGRVFCDVTPDTGKPFTVAAGPARVAVLGTRFDVRLDSASVDVTVEEGRVAVHLAGRDRPEGLGAGDALQVDIASGALRRSTMAPEAMAAWRRGQLVVDGWTVARLIGELGRYHRGVIMLRDPRFGGLMVSGFYDLTQPVEAVRSVVQAHGGKITTYGPWLMVVNGA